MSEDDGNLISRKIMQKLERFAECVEDGEDVDIGRDWLDALTTLGLLERYQKSPARWLMSADGEAALRALPSAQPTAEVERLREDRLRWSDAAIQQCERAETAEAALAAMTENAKALAAKAEALRVDLLNRGEVREFNGQKTRTVAAGRTVWFEFCETLATHNKLMEGV